MTERGACAAARAAAEPASELASAVPLVGLSGPLGLSLFFDRATTFCSTACARSVATSFIDLNLVNRCLRRKTGGR